MDKEIVPIHFQDKVISLHFTSFEAHIDVDQLTKIDYSNLYAELITVSSLMNRVGMWKAEADNALGEARLQRNIKMAQLGEHYRKILKDKPGVSRVTKDMVDNAITLDISYQDSQKIRLRKGKEAGYLDSLYWAIKSKEGKLNRIGEKMNLSPEEFEKHIVEGTWNGILIKAAEKLIK